MLGLVVLLHKIDKNRRQSGVEGEWFSVCRGVFGVWSSKFWARCLVYVFGPVNKQVGGSFSGRCNPELDNAPSAESSPPIQI